MRLRAYSALALCLVVSACGGGSRIDLPAPPAVSKRCSQLVRPEPLRFWFRAADGTILDGAVLGSGEPGVVLVHGDPSDLCGELSTAQLLVSQAISGPPQIGVGTESTNDLDGFAGVPKLTAPLLVLVSPGDHRRTPVHKVQRMVAGHGRLVVYPGDYHAGALLFDAPYRYRVRTALLSFLRAES